MADYQLVSGFTGVKRTSDGAMIPNADGNRDWQRYQQWLKAGNTPDPVPPPPKTPSVPELQPVKVADPQSDEDAVNLRTLDEKLDELNQRIDSLDQTFRRSAPST